MVGVVVVVMGTDCGAIANLPLAFSSSHVNDARRGKRKPTHKSHPSKEESAKKKKGQRRSKSHPNPFHRVRILTLFGFSSPTNTKHKHTLSHT